ncbi:MAG: MarC family protein [Vulcanisaeta sp.]
MSIAIDVLIMVSQLIAIIDPMGALPLIMSMPNIEQTSVFRRALRIIAIAVPTLLIFFAVAGPYILTAFNISIADFRIAGGIVLLVIGIDTLREGAPRTMGLSPEDYVFVPIVTPMLAAFIFRAVTSLMPARPSVVSLLFLALRVFVLGFCLRCGCF